MHEARSNLPAALRQQREAVSGADVTELRSELLSFPAGKHDDQVDALGLVGQMLDIMVAGPKPKLPDTARKRDRYREIDLAPDMDFWKVAI